MPKVINLWAGPGSGKSTTAAGVFFLMKIRNLKVELIREYAKDLAYQNLLGTVDQSEIFEEQMFRQGMVTDQVDWIVCDCPPLLSLIYGDVALREDPEWQQKVWNGYSSYNERFNYFVKRVKPFQHYGRTQNEEAAKEKDQEIIDLLNRYDEDFFDVAGDVNAPICIVQHLVQLGALERIDGDYDIKSPNG